MEGYKRTPLQNAALLEIELRQAGVAIGRAIDESASADVFWNAVYSYAYLRFPDSVESVDTATYGVTL